MSATLLVHGTIRQIRDRNKRDSGELFGREASVLTEVGSVLGETLAVLVFTPREGERWPEMREGLSVTWVVDVDASRYGLGATFRRSATIEDLATFAIAPGTPRMEFDQASAPSHVAEPVSA